MIVASESQGTSLCWEVGACKQGGDGDSHLQSVPQSDGREYRPKSSSIKRDYVKYFYADFPFSRCVG
jgi:hypothetical protein